MKIKLRLDKIFGLLFLVLVVSIFVRFYNLDATGYVTDELVIITAGIKHFVGSSFPVSLYDMATPGGQWPIGLFVTMLSNTDFSFISEFGIMDYASIDVNYDLYYGLETFARLPSAILGVLSGVFVYLLVKELYGRKAGIVSFALFSFCPILIDYSRIALLEIYQIFYMMVSLYFLYLGVTHKKNDTIFVGISGLFLGLTIAAKLNSLILVPLFVIFLFFAKSEIKKKKTELSFNIIGSLKHIGILLVTCLLLLCFVFNFDFSTPFQIYNYYSGTSGATGFQFVLFSLLCDAFYFINPFVWLLVIGSLFLIYLDKNKLKMNDYFVLFLLVIIICSGFFDAHSSIKRGIQYVSLFFIIATRLFANNTNTVLKQKWLYLIPLFIVVSNLILVAYYFPYTGLAKNIVCTSQECLDAHSTRNYDGKIIADYINSLDNAIVYDSTGTTSLVVFYLNQPWNYLTGGLARLQVGECPNIDVIRSNGFNTVIGGGNCFSFIEGDIKDCEYETITVKNYEMLNVYNISACS